MIQRIQTVYLFLASAVMVLINWLPLVKFTIKNNETENLVDFTTFGIENNINDVAIYVTTYPIAIITFLTAVLSFIAIFMYKNRTKQKNVALISLFLSLMFYAIFIIYWWYLKDFISTTQTTISYGLAIPAVSLILNMLAAKAINADEKLVRSTDRIR